MYRPVCLHTLAICWLPLLTLLLEAELGLAYELLSLCSRFALHVLKAGPKEKVEDPQSPHVGGRLAPGGKLMQGMQQLR